MRNQNELTSIQKNCPAFRKTGMCGKVIAIDLDDTLFHNTCFPEIGPPLKDVVQDIQKIKQQGYYLIIYTARLSSDYEISWEKQLRLIQFTLSMQNIPYDEIWQGKGKPVCCGIIDDRSWKSIKEFLTNENNIQLCSVNIS